MSKHTIAKALGEWKMKAKIKSTKSLKEEMLAVVRKERKAPADAGQTSYESADAMLQARNENEKWRHVIKDYGFGGIQYCVYNNKQELIACTERKEVAELIASAPQLLEVLKEAIALQEKHYGYATNMHLQIIAWADKAKAALLNVEGEDNGN